MEPGGKMFEYGLMGAVLLLMLSTFLWAFRKLFSRGLQHFDEIAKFMHETVKVLGELSKEQTQQREVLDDISQEFQIHRRK